MKSEYRPVKVDEGNGLNYSARLVGAKQLKCKALLVYS